MSKPETTKARTEIYRCGDAEYGLRLHVEHQSFNVGYEGSEEEVIGMRDMLVKALSKAGVQWL